VFYIGLIEQFLNIKVILLVTDRCHSINKDFNKFQITDETYLKVINETVKLYKDPYHLYKSFMCSIIENKTGIDINFLKVYFENDVNTLDINT
jgi:hypothetical protein